MGLAEMIAKLRKKCGFSQEELGEKLDVSRQAVSKWESGQAVPELEKLKEMCRIFEVSMDELLGGEKQENPEKEAPAETDKGLSSEEVAAIVRTEIAKIPQPQPVKKRSFWTSAALVLMAVLTVVTQMQYSNLKEQMNILRSSVDSVRNEVSGTIGSIKHSIKQSLEEQSSLISQSAYEFTQIDPGKQKATVRFEVMPKKLTEDTAIRLIFSVDGKEPIPCDLIHEGNALFVGETEVPFGDPIYYSMIIEQDGSTYTVAQQSIYDLNRASYELQINSYPQGITYNTSTITFGDIQVDIFCEETYDESLLNAPMEGTLRFYIDEELKQESKLDLFKGKEPKFGDIKYMIENFQHINTLASIDHDMGYEGWETARCEIEIIDRFGIRYIQNAFVITPEEPQDLSPGETQIIYPEA